MLINNVFEQCWETGKVVKISINKTHFKKINPYQEDGNNQKCLRVKNSVY